MNKFLEALRKQVQHQEITLFMLFLAFCLLKFPIQHHISIARFQHYGLCLYLWSLGYFFQLIWSWKHLTRKGRASLFSTGVYVGIFAIIFYSSPWLDVRMAVQTEEQDILRLVYSAVCAGLGFIVAIIWLSWVLERKDDTDHKGNAL